VILEDVARFRALSPEDRIRTIRSLLADGAFLLSRSPNPAWAKPYAEEQKLLERRNIREFLERHRDQWQIPVDESGDDPRATRCRATWQPW
jgi:hypothetical protein